MEAMRNPSPSVSVRRPAFVDENPAFLGSSLNFYGETQMHARPKVRDVILLAKMKRWLAIVRQPFLSRKHTTTQARRNYLRLVRRHESLATAHNLTEQAAFESEPLR